MTEMVPGLPALGVRFEIDKVGAGAYGVECWKMFWRTVDPESLGVALLYEGDTAATLRGRENVFCIAIQADAEILRAVQDALEQSAVYLSVAASPMFVESGDLAPEPLPGAGKIDGQGNLADAYWAQSGLSAVREEKEG